MLVSYLSNFFEIEADRERVRGSLNMDPLDSWICNNLFLEFLQVLVLSLDSDDSCLVENLVDKIMGPSIELG